MRVFGLFIVIIFYGCLVFGQDPGKAIEITLMRDGDTIPESELSSYHIALHIRLRPNYSKDSDFRREDGSTAFRYFEWDPYYGETHEIEIVHKGDTMRITQFMKLGGIKRAHHNSSDKLYLWNVLFRMKVPFKPGIYIAKNFIKRGWDIEYVLSPTHRWVNLEKHK